MKQKGKKREERKGKKEKKTGRQRKCACNVERGKRMGESNL